MTRRTAIVFALFWELEPLGRRMGAGFLKAVSPCVLLEEGRVALVRSGIGKEKAASAAEKTVNCFRPEFLISAGLCGALIEELKVGDIVVSDLSDGKIFCSEKILFGYEEKLAAHRQHKAIAVDMESEGVASVAKKHGIPFIAVKAVSDGMKDDVPRFPFITPPQAMRFKEAVAFASERLAEFLFEYLKKGA